MNGMRICAAAGQAISGRPCLRRDELRVCYAVKYDFHLAKSVGTDNTLKLTKGFACKSYYVYLF